MVGVCIKPAACQNDNLAILDAEQGPARVLGYPEGPIRIRIDQVVIVLRFWKQLRWCNLGNGLLN